MMLYKNNPLHLHVMLAYESVIKNLNRLRKHSSANGSGAASEASGQVRDSIRAAHRANK